MIGQTLSHFKITAKLGEGGMGEVYRAEDTKLGREVAIKVLPEAFVQDAERLARFEREAKVLASLNHPNIGGIYGLEEAEGQKALVLELVEGPTLAERIKQGPIPVDEALPIAKQIAEALEAAHEQGIIHRDLKPANIKLKPDGTVKVLDFGLAKAFQPDASDPNLSQSPTISLTAAATQIGMVIGTAAYMAPEQAKGKVVDKRTDIWAFGAVLYEMLTGQRPFAGDDLSTTLARVIEREPDWEILPGKLSPVLATYLRRCLVKEPKQRVHDIADVRLAMDGAFDVAVASAGVGGTVPLWRRVWPLAAALVVGAVSTVVLLPNESPVASGEVVRSLIVSPGLSFDSRDPFFTVSPDGKTVIFATSQGLYRRDLSQLTARLIPETEGASQPFFSPGGAALGFVDAATGSMRRTSLAGQSPVTVVSWPPGDIIGGASWGTDGQILVGRLFDGLYEVSADTGVAEPLTTLRAGEALHVNPEHLPGGGAALFTIVDEQFQFHVSIVSLETGEYQRLVAGSSPRYVSTGHLVFLRDGRLWAAAFDAERRALTGDAVPVLEDVHSTLTVGHFAVGGTSGSLVYVSGSDLNTELRWVNREGVTLGVAGVIDGLVRALDLSDDDRRLAFESADGSLRAYDIERSVTTELKGGPGGDPNWSPDGRHLAYAEGLIGKVSTMPSDGGEPTEIFSREDGTFWLDDWSRAGDRLAGHSDGSVNTGIVLSIGGDVEPVVFAEAENLDEAEFSPDGQWIAYNARYSGEQNVYVVPYPPPGERVQVSSNGGVQPQWRPDGQELFYLSLTGTLMAVPIDAREGFRAGAPTPLFDTGLTATSEIEQYVVGSDGERFLLPTAVGASSESLVLVQDWFEELTARVPSP